MENKINSKLVGIACAKLEVKELQDSNIAITPMIIAHEMLALFDQFSDQELWMRADKII